MRLDLLAPLGLILRSRSKSRTAPRIAGTDLGNAVTHLVGSGLVHVPDVSPEILVALFPFDRFARLPLFLQPLASGGDSAADRVHDR